VAFDPQRDDWRTFRVDRITPRTPTGPRFAARELPGDVVDRVRQGVSAAGWRHRARIRVHAPAQVVAERVNPAAGTVEPLDPDSCVLHTGADRLETIAVWVGLLDLDFTIEDPPELATLLRALATRYLRAAP
jgi:predicted DNA-binding transcriptional regulator YafY